MAKDITESHQADGHTAPPATGNGDLATPSAPLRHYARSRGEGSSLAAASDGNLAAKVCHPDTLNMLFGAHVTSPACSCRQ